MSDPFAALESAAVAAKEAAQRDRAIEAAQARILKGKRRHKYGIPRALSWDGRLYDSPAERDRYAELELLVKAGTIAELVDHPRILLLPPLFYFKPDSSYLERGRLVYEDVKGPTTPRWLAVRQLWHAVGPGVLRVVKRRGRRAGFAVVEEIPPGEYVLVKRGEVAA